MSSEHFISKEVLHLIGEEIHFHGFPWIKAGEEKVLPYDSVKANVLCKRHNEMLSPLDAEAMRFFAVLKDLKYDNLKTISRGTRHQFSGDGLELWLLKTALGLVASRNARMKGKKKIKWEPPLELLQILYNGIPFRHGLGLHIDAEIGRSTSLSSAITFAPLTDTRDNSLVGCQLSIWSWLFILSFVAPVAGAPGTIFQNSRYRPRHLNFNEGHSILELTWADETPSGTDTIHVKLSKQNPA